MQIKVGTDIINIERIESSIDKFGDKFLERFLKSSEREAVKSIETIAGYWAAKEAVSKALGCGIGKELSFLDIEIKKNKRGAPYFLVASAKYAIKSSSLSISHDGGFAIAVVAIVLGSRGHL